MASVSNTPGQTKLAQSNKALQSACQKATPLSAAERNVMWKVPEILWRFETGVKQTFRF